MESEKIQVLKLVRDNELTLEEGLDCLKAIYEQEGSNMKSSNPLKKWLHIRVREGNIEKVNINIPLVLARLALKFMDMSTAPIGDYLKIQEQDLNLSKSEFKEMINDMDHMKLDGRLIDICDANDNKVVEVYIK